VSPTIILVHDPYSGACFYDLSLKKTAFEIPYVGKHHPIPVAFTPPGGILLLGQNDKILLYDSSTGQLLNSIDVQGAVGHVSLKYTQY
jgi:hypothetical protein